MAVAPAALSLHASGISSFDNSSFLYELHPSQRLPSIDCARYVKNVLFTPRQLALVNKVLHHGRFLLATSFLVGATSSFAIWMAPAPVGRWVALSLLITELPAMLANLISLRFDMLVLLSGVYEIWFASVFNGVSLFLLGLAMNDRRCVAQVIAAIGFEVIVLLDANNRFVKNSIVVCLVGCLLYSSCAFYTTTGLIDHADTQLVLYSYGPHQLFASDVTVNGLLTGILIFVRNAYRKYATVGKNKSGFTVPCITYRCRLQLRLVSCSSTMQTIVPSAAADTTQNQQPTEANDFTTPLRFIPIPTVFGARNTMLRSVGRHHSSPRPMVRWKRILLHSVGVVGVLFSYGPLIVRVLAQDATPITTIDVYSQALSWMGLVASLVFCCTFFAFYQRQLLKRLLSNFDFLFISVQYTVSQLCVCDVLAWGSGCVTVWTTWLWVHWVISLDALPPIWKTRLGVFKPFVVVVIVLGFTQGTILCADLFIWNTWAYQDRQLLTWTIAGHTTTLRVVSLMFGRMISIFFWSVRILWRVIATHSHELLLLQGKVEYTDTHLQSRWRHRQQK